MTRDVYHQIRHLMYATHGLWALAGPLLLQNWIAGWAMLVTFISAHLVRVRREEQAILEHLGEAYRPYMERTDRLLPRFWR